MGSLPGIAGTLFPGRFLARGLEAAPGWSADDASHAPAARLQAWWRDVEATCGPATGLRALFDAAMGLFGILGFRARDAVFEATHASCLLQARSDDEAIVLVVRGWARRPSHSWRDLVMAARAAGADWAFLFAPPYLSLVPARGQATRHSVDFTFPDAFDHRSVARLWTLASARAFQRHTDRRTPLDRIVAAAATWQDQVRDDLQAGVLSALSSLGSVVAGHTRPHDRTSAPFVDEALVLVYRILFLLFAESRDLVPAAHPVYGQAYSIAAGCRDALTGATPRGYWDGLAAVTRLSRVGCESADLIVKPFNGRLFARASAPSLEPRRRPGRPTRATGARDAAMRAALVALGSRPGSAGREDIDYADLGVEQLGAVYERLLDVDPARRVRKETGTFYTPRPLAEFLVRRTLGPLLAGATADAILDLRIVDPAMGSGAFLVAACHHMASAYERALVDEGGVSPADVTDVDRADFRRLVAERCLAGVDVNPIAVQLARLSLWLATLARDKPLTFLDHRLRTGNSLIGAAPDDLARTPVGRHAEPAALPLFGDAPLEAALARVCRPLAELSHRRDDTVGDVRVKEAMWRRLSSDRSPVEAWRLATSLWCARWFWPSGAPPSPAELRSVIDHALGRPAAVPERIRDAWIAAARDAADRHRFFHWPLEFPDIFYDSAGHPRARPGFDAVIGNPPWEMLRRDEGAGDRRDGSGLVRFVRESALYPSCGRGHLNLYQAFVERALWLARDQGRIGLLLPWGLATDDGAEALRRRLIDRGGLDTVVGLDNAAGMFPIHRGMRFMALTGTPGSATIEIHGRFGVRTEREIDDLPASETGLAPPAYPTRMTPHLLRTLGGPSLRIPDIRDSRQLALLHRLRRDFPSLGSRDGWNVTFGRELNATDDRASFGAAGLPVLEGKHLSAFEANVSATRTFVARAEAERRLPDRRFDRPRLGYRDVSAVTNRRTLIAAVIPSGALTTHTIFCLRTKMDVRRQHMLCALLNSFVLDFVARLLAGGHLTTSLVESLPAPTWRGRAVDRQMARLAARAARGLASSDSSEDISTKGRLQAMAARCFNLDADELQTVLDAFPLVRDEEKAATWGAFRTPARQRG